MRPVRIQALPRGMRSKCCTWCRMHSAPVLVPAVAAATAVMVAMAAACALGSKVAEQQLMQMLGSWWDASSAACGAQRLQSSLVAV